MNGTESRLIGETIREYISIKDAADRLGVSRPTLYAYIQKYDEGMNDPNKRNEIPITIREFFDLISGRPQPEEVKVFLAVKGNPKEASDDKPIAIRKMQENSRRYEAMRREMDYLTKLIEETEDRYTEHIALMEKTRDELVMNRKLISDNPDDCAEYRVRVKTLENKIEELRCLLDRDEKQLKDAKSMVARLSNDLRMADFEERRLNDTRYSWTDDNGLMTLSVGNNGRSMVLFQYDSEEGAEADFSVILHIKSPVGDLAIGTYRPQEDRSFVLIDDVLPNLHPQYEVICECNGMKINSGRYPLQFR